MKSQNDTIYALASPPGTGALGIIRVSGPEAIRICNELFPSKNLLEVPGFSLHFGKIEADSRIVDEVLLSVFRAPKSFTGEDVVELSCHGSSFILQEIMKLLSQRGVRIAKAGEFTLRAFLNRKMDLSQAEAVADLIASESSAAHETAMHQMRGGFSNEIRELRTRLIHFASMIELELDFSEEDVEFANRAELMDLLKEVKTYVEKLIASFDLGNVIKNGVPVVIVGKPNAGKSTLLNVLFNEELALVTDIEGTTRDSIEDELVLDGIRYRFIDTAGLRETSDTIEAMGVKRSIEKLKQASIILYLFDVSKTNVEGFQEELTSIQREISEKSRLIPVANHMDKLDKEALEQFKVFEGLCFISAKNRLGIEDLLKALRSHVMENQHGRESSIVTNSRHYGALVKCSDSLSRAMDGLNQSVPSDLLAMDIRQALHYLGEITGEVTTEDLLDNIFSKFCIGK